MLTASKFLSRKPANYATSIDYTGQRLDGIGLLFYNARYYDPAIGRFISADTLVPGNASGGMDGVALRPLTVAFHEPGFIATLNGEGANADKLHWVAQRIHRR